MWLAFLIMFIITAGISWLWANGIEKADKYQKENPNVDMTKGWLEWDDNKVTTEGEL